MPSITRRRLVGGGAALAALAYGGYRLDRGAPDANFESWAPDPGIWPLPRYDPANTAHNPNANPPREEPTVRAVTSVDVSETAAHPLVGTSRVFLYGPGLESFPDAGGTARTISEARLHLAGLGPDGHVHALERGSDVEVQYDAVGYDGTRELYRVPLDGGFPEWLTVGAGEVYVGDPSRHVVAVERSGRDWRVGGMHPALANGRLYVSGAPDGVIAYEERSGVDRTLEPGPTRRWTARGPPGESREPAVAGGRLVVGTREMVNDRGVVGAFDAETGDQLWEPRTLGGSVSTPAVAGNRGYATVFGEGLDDGNVVALDLTTGDTVWSDRAAWSPFDPVLGGDTLVVLGQVREDGETRGGRVRAYDAASGDERWTVEFEDSAPVSPGIALVEDRVLVTSGGTLYELA